jgi:DNA-binding transcriptional LysR family regulator
VPLVWIGPASARTVSVLEQPIPLAVYEAPCFFRQRAQAALDQAGLPWRIAFTSPSLYGLWAAIEAGLGITLRTAVGLPATLRVRDDLPAIADPSLAICLHDGGRALSPTQSALKSIIAETVVEKLRA